MRRIVLDTETTGLDVSEGHRIIEIGGVELQGRKLTGRRLHHYLQPGREIDAGAAAVHGITSEFLADKPRFADVAAEWLEFLAGAELVIHNAEFDIGFIDNELKLAGVDARGLRAICGVLDTLKLARELHPGQHANLDVLCRRYGVDNSQRDLHGALLDAEILADVYLAMTGGQATLELGPQAASVPVRSRVARQEGGPRASLRVIRASADELTAHERRLDEIEDASEGRCVWRALDRPG